MAKGIKSSQSLQVGDLLLLRDTNEPEYYYQAPDLDSPKFFIESENGIVGEVVNDNVADQTNPEPDLYIYFTSFKLPNGRIAFVKWDSAIFTYKANPEYDYAEAKKAFDWTGLFGSISAISNSIFGILAGKNTNRVQTAGGNGQYDWLDQTEPQANTFGNWLKNNLILVILFPLVILLGVLLFKKEKPKSGLKVNPDLNYQPQKI